MNKKDFISKILGDDNHFIIVDGGSRNGAIDLNYLNQYSKFFCFEPDTENFKDTLQSKKLENGGIVNWSSSALCNHDGQTTIFISQRGNASSTLVPNKECLKHFKLDNWSELSEIISEIKVPCLRLNTFLQNNGIEYIDLIKLDTQGNELDILKSLDEKINDVSLIKTEVEMIPLYEDQPLYHDVSKYLYKKGFELVDFEILEPCKRFHSKDNLHPSSYRLVWADAIFVRNPYDFEHPRALQKGLLLACLGYSDLALYILKNIKYLKSSEYLELEKLVILLKKPKSNKGKIRYFIEKLFGLIIKQYDWRKGKQVASTKLKS